MCTVFKSFCLLCVRKSCTQRELLQLLGHLNFASNVIRSNRSFVSYLSLSITVKKMHHHVLFNKECREDIRMWMSFLKQWNGVSLFLDLEVKTSSDIQLLTDVASTIVEYTYYQGQ